MNQGQAIQIINELLPEISRTKDPETVITKYASEHNLAPAQLERLGQVFNTAKTISYMEKSASRGGSFSLVDIEKMVANYMELDAPTQIEKAASEAPVVARNPFEIPNLWVHQEIRKVAKAKVNDPVAKNLEVVLAKQAADAEIKDFMADAEDLMYLKQALITEIHEGLDKLAHAIYDTPQIYAALERDSMASPHRNENALEHLANKLDEDYKGNYVRADLDKLASVRVVKDTTGHLGALCELEENIQLYQGTLEIMREKVAAWNPDDLKKLDLARQTAIEDGREGDLEDEDPEKPEPSTGPNPGYDEEEEDEDPPADSTTDGASSTSNSGKAIPVPTTAKDPDVDARAEFDKALEAQRKMREGAGTHAETIRRLDHASAIESETPTPNIDKGFAKYDEVHGQVKGVLDPKLNKAIDWLRAKVQKSPTHNTRALARDTARGDISRTVILQKAIMSDDVLSQSDPQRVASLYNTLYKANPEMMSDPNVMVAALREAVQYDGVMPHTYDQFVSTSKNRADQEAKSTENRSKRYLI